MENLTKQAKYNQEIEQKGRKEDNATNVIWLLNKEVLFFLLSWV